jgi:PST family polysaccharide transporter
VSPFAVVGAAFGAASLVALLAGVVRQRLFAVYLGPSGVGFLAAATRLQDLLVTACLAGTVPGVVRAVSAARGRAEPAVAVRAWRSATGIVLLGSLLAIVAGLAARHPIARYLFGGDEHAWAVGAVLAGVPLLVLSAVLVAVLNGLEEFRSLVLHNAAVVAAALALVAALVPSLGLRGALWAMPAAGLLAVGLATVLARGALRRRLQTRLTASPAEASGGLGSVRDLLGVGGVTYADTCVGSAIGVLVGLLFVNARDIAEIGFFHAAQSASRLYMGFLTTSVFSYLLPRLSGLGREAAVREQNETLATLAWLVVVIAGAVVVLRSEVVLLLYGSAFRAVEPLLAIMAVGDLLHGMVWVAGATFIPAARLRAYAATSMASHAAFVILLCLLVPRAGAPGAALAYTLGRAASFAVVAAVQWKAGWFRLGRRELAVAGSGLALLAALALVPPAARPAQAAGLLALLAWAWIFRTSVVRGWPPPAARTR